MGAVSYGQAGYVGTSMSARAREAYESGEMPMSKWTRKARGRNSRVQSATRLGLGIPRSG